MKAGITRIRANHFRNRGSSAVGGSLLDRLEFYETKESDVPSGMLTVHVPFSIFAHELLFGSLSESLLDPFLTSRDGGSKDFLSDSLFSDEEKRPFSLDERNLLMQTLAETKVEIKDTFKTTESQQKDIDQKIDYLMRKVAELDRFNWKRLFVSTLVGISVDLLFGTVIPSSLLDAFKKVLTRLAEGRKLFGIDKPKLK